MNDTQRENLATYLAMQTARRGGRRSCWEHNFLAQKAHALPSEVDEVMSIVAARLKLADDVSRIAGFPVTIDDIGTQEIAVGATYAT